MVPAASGRSLRDPEAMGGGLAPGGRVWRCFHPQLPPPPGVKSEGGGVPTTSTAGLLEVEALPRKRGEGEEGRGPKN